MEQAATDGETKATGSISIWENRQSRDQSEAETPELSHMTQSTGNMSKPSGGRFWSGDFSPMCQKAERCLASKALTVRVIRVPRFTLYWSTLLNNRGITNCAGGLT